jgi:hypothetical protein
MTCNFLYIARWLQGFRNNFSNTNQEEEDSGRPRKLWALWKGTDHWPNRWRKGGQFSLFLYNACIVLKFSLQCEMCSIQRPYKFESRFLHVITTLFFLRYNFEVFISMVPYSIQRNYKFGKKITSMRLHKFPFIRYSLKFSLQWDAYQV